MARLAALRWVKAAPRVRGGSGPFWRLLRAYVEDAETLGLNDARLRAE